jgi:RHS repeat-associated protein
VVFYHSLLTGLNGAPLAVIEGGTVSFVRTDHIGRPVFGTNSTGTKVWTAAYLPFGGVRTTTGTPINLRFPGQWFQSESGLHQNWMRDYDPTTGRYLQADPLGLVDGASVYGYVKQNPGRWIDPRGLQSRSIDDLVCDNFPGMGYCQQRPMQCSANETICRKVDEYPVPDMGQKVCVYDCGGDGLLRTYHGLFETCDEVVFIPGF